MEFAEFYQSSRDDCLRIVLLNVGNRQLAEELVAEGFARAWVSWRKVRVHPAPQAGWCARRSIRM
jgi:DNA-directed RNA polymerase specialized sigma24 family protein